MNCFWRARHLSVDDGRAVRATQRLAPARGRCAFAVFRVHAVDCAECETKEGHIDRIEWRFEFTGELTDDQRARLLEIAQRCPVHRTLMSEIDIRLI